jgi:Alpha/beta hydrolase of unknown function (DUF900)
MTIARAKVVPPDDSRFSLAAVGLADWRLHGVEPVSGEVGNLLAQAGGGADVLIYVHGFNQTFETAALDAARLSDAIKFRGRTDYPALSDLRGNPHSSSHFRATPRDRASLSLSHRN